MHASSPITCQNLPVTNWQFVRWEDAAMADRATSGTPRMVRGSVVTHHRRCGKPTCRCAGGEQLHASTVLSYSEQGRTRFVMLPPDEVAAVRTAVQRYRKAQAKLEAHGEAGRAALIERLGADRGNR